MTTAHRPTFHNALAKGDAELVLGSVPTAKVSSRDLPGHRVVKERKIGQGSIAELSTKDFKAVLELKEQTYFRNKHRTNLLANLDATERVQRVLPIENLPDDDSNAFPEDADDEGPKHLSASLSRKRNVDSTQRFPKEGSGAVVGSEEEDGSEEDGDDEEELELMRELANIKRERAEEDAKVKEAEANAKAAEERQKILKSNPLLNVRGVGGDTAAVQASLDAGGDLQRSWEDDVVFKNQAKTTAAEKAELKKKKFVNDAVRSQFHRKFLQKYIV
eukprot:Lankesteria_metandrocarpae@DN4652_c0_g1_i1.p1